MVTTGARLSGSLIGAWQAPLADLGPEGGDKGMDGYPRNTAGSAGATALYSAPSRVHSTSASGPEVARNPRRKAMRKNTEAI